MKAMIRTMKIQQIYFSSQREENATCLQDETKNGQTNNNNSDNDDVDVDDDDINR